jgi:hypothetical protein
VDGEISEKMWKSYQKGDVGVFMKRLQTIGDSAPAEQLAAKYKNDHEFRTYAQRYIKQFEKLYQSAVRDQSDTIVTQAIATSDVAKLYRILCVAAEQRDISAIL